MLKIYFGDMEDAIFNTDMYFSNAYEEAWLADDFAVKVIHVIDKSEVLGSYAIHSPYLGVISPEKLSRSTKTLLLMKNFPDFQQGDVAFAALGTSVINELESVGWTAQVVAPTKEYPSITDALDAFLKENATRRR